MMDHTKYSAYSHKIWENGWLQKSVEKAPIWCAVDLRDGNQALQDPMDVETKIRFFNLLKEIGFKEIEVGFPSASETEFAFVRELIEKNMIPDDVTIQVLTQCRDELIEKTFEAIKGCKKAIVHFYNSTSDQQVKYVFNKSYEKIVEIAVNGAKKAKELAKQIDTQIIYEYSPESFTQTQMEFALKVCNAVIDVLEPTPDNKMIINLPATVEVTTPDVYAGQIEWMCKNFKRGNSIITSIHPHNDTVMAVSAAHLAMRAGAQRVEGTLFGNGERSGNLDLVTVAMNLLLDGINPELDLSKMNRIKNIYEECTNMSVPARQPYSGANAFIAYSGSHQDAIKKTLEHYNKSKNKCWNRDVAYIPIDPADIGREYEPIIRINSQSGKGGVAYILENEFGYRLPKTMYAEFGKIIKHFSDEKGKELTSTEILDTFKNTYLSTNMPMKLEKYGYKIKDDKTLINCTVAINNNVYKIDGKGEGPIDAFVNGLYKLGIDKYSIQTYEEHALSKGNSAEAVAYIGLKNGEDEFFGVGVDTNTTTASFKAIISALNRHFNFTKASLNEEFKENKGGSIKQHVDHKALDIGNVTQNVRHYYMEGQNIAVDEIIVK